MQSSQNPENALEDRWRKRSQTPLQEEAPKSSGRRKYDRNAYTITSIYHGGTGALQMYATPPTEPKIPGGQPEYHMTQLKGYAITGDVETFRKGAAAFRNGRDWAKEQRDRFIADANGTAHVVCLQRR